MFPPRALFRILIPLLVPLLLLAGCVMPDGLDDTPAPPPVASTPEIPAEDLISEDPPAEDLAAMWQAQDYRVLDVSHGVFAGRTRSLIRLVAPDAVTPEQRLATLMAEALRSYRQGEIEDTAFLTLWPGEGELENPDWPLARITFASDQCGWTGDECQGSHWSRVFASAVVFTEEQLRIDALHIEAYSLFHDPYLAQNEKGQPLSQAGWACYDPVVDIPAEGGCYNTYSGTLAREDLNMDRAACQLSHNKWAGYQWVWPDEEWGILDTACAQNQLERHIASQLDLDLATVAGNFDAMMTLYWVSDEIRVIGEIPQALEEQQDFQRR